MRNRLKTLGILAVFVAASFVGVKGSAAATGQVSVPMTMGAATFNIGTSNATFSVAAHPFIEDPNPSFYEGQYTGAQTLWPGQSLSVYNLTCWTFNVTANGKPVPALSGLWKCATFLSGAAVPDPTMVTAESITGTLDSSSLESCYDWMDQNCTAPALVAGNMMPKLDLYVGQIVVANVVTNWCSFIAPTGNPDSGFDAQGLARAPLGCVYDPEPVTLAATNGVRALADSGPPAGMTAKVPMRVQAGPTDCHVPKVKGLTLRKAKARLLAHNCRAAVHYVKGTRVGRVKYQPLSVGTGKPRGYRVKLAVVR